MEKKPLILITNDDGINSDGLWAAVQSLAGTAEVVVAAPDRDQSGMGTSVSLTRPVRATEVASQVAGVKAYSIEGTPADCTILALEKLFGTADLVVSGINKGANLGEDVMISGTVGGALQAYTRDIPSVAISVASLKAARFDTAGQLLRRLADQIASGVLSGPVFLNINLPSIEPKQIEGVEITRLARRAYTDTVTEGDDGRRPYYWIARSRPEPKFDVGTDAWAVRNNRVSITPLHTDMTNISKLPALEELSLLLSEPLKGTC